MAQESCYPRQKSRSWLAIGEGKRKRSGEKENEREGLKEKARPQAAKVADNIHFPILWKSLENQLGYKEARQSPGLFFLYV